MEQAFCLRGTCSISALFVGWVVRSTTKGLASGVEGSKPFHSTYLTREGVAKQQTRTIWNRVPGRIAGANPVALTSLFTMSYLLCQAGWFV